MPISYYTLLVRVDGLWTIQFGDYDRRVVYQERDDNIESGWLGEPLLKRNTKIIETAEDQLSIQAAVDKLNEGKK